MIPGRTWILLYLGRTMYKLLWACLALYFHWCLGGYYFLIKSKVEFVLTTTEDPHVYFTLGASFSNVKINVVSDLIFTVDYYCIGFSTGKFSCTPIGFWICVVWGVTINKQANFHTQKPNLYTNCILKFVQSWSSTAALRPSSLYLVLLFKLYG